MTRRGPWTGTVRGSWARLAVLACAALAHVPVAAQTAQLVATSVEVRPQLAVIPFVGVQASVGLENRGQSDARISKATLRLVRGEEDVSHRFWVEPAGDNALLVPSGKTALLRFTVQGFHDSPAGRLAVHPAVEWYDAADSMVGGERGCEAMLEKGWAASQTPEMHGTFESVADEALGSRGVPRAAQFRVDGNVAKGMIAARSPRVPVRPAVRYIAGVEYCSDRSGWGSSLDKGLTVVQYGDEGALRAVDQHLYELPFWTQERMSFETLAGATEVQMSVWMRAFETRQTGEMRWCLPFLLPQHRLQEVCSAERPGTLNARRDASTLKLPKGELSPVVYLGDDWETQGNWMGRHGGRGYVLCGMGGCGDVVGILGPGETMPRQGGVEQAGARRFDYRLDVWEASDIARYWVPSPGWNDRRALRNPQLIGSPVEHFFSAWDDHGEAHPFDSNGPDLKVTVDVPETWHRLSLYFCDYDWGHTHRPRLHKVTVFDPGGEAACRLYVGPHWSGTYKSVLVKGPIQLTIRIEKGPSVTASLCGIFLDAPVVVGTTLHLLDSKAPGVVRPVLNAPAPDLRRLLRYVDVPGEQAPTWPPAYITQVGDETRLARQDERDTRRSPKANALVREALAADLCHAFTQWTALRRHIQAVFSLSAELLGPEVAQAVAEEAVGWEMEQGHFFAAAIWAAAQTNALLANREEKRAAKLLHQYAGTFAGVMPDFADLCLRRSLSASAAVLSPSDWREQTRERGASLNVCFPELGQRCFQAIADKFGEASLAGSERLGWSMALYRSGHFSAAQQALELLVSEDTQRGLDTRGLATAWLYLGLCQLAQGQIEAGEASLQRLFKEFPGTWAAHRACSFLDGIRVKQGEVPANGQVR